MSQVIKFVYADGNHRMLRPSIPQTLKDVEKLNHDFKASWFSLVDGHYAKPKKKISNA